MSKLSHIDEQNRPTMVDVSDKQATARTAHARTPVQLPAAIAAGRCTVVRACAVRAVACLSLTSTMVGRF
ncbi:MAG: hypothetical protein P8X98_12610 [Woeseiaceae bacterium]